MARVLIACEYSGRMRQAFAERGHEVTSCDLLPAEDGSPDHYTGDVFDLIDAHNFDLMIAHPPCTYLANSGVRWLYNGDGTLNEARWANMREGATFFHDLLTANIPHIAVENPVMHKHALAIVGRKASQFVQPWQHGDGETKATGFWLKGLAPMPPSNVVEGREQRVWKLPPSADRWKERSRTYPGIAAAAAAWWGNHENWTTA
jgi:hypothetical protein